MHDIPYFATAICRRCRAAAAAIAAAVASAAVVAYSVASILSMFVSYFVYLTVLFRPDHETCPRRASQDLSGAVHGVACFSTSSGWWRRGRMWNVSGFNTCINPQASTAGVVPNISRSLSF